MELIEEKILLRPLKYSDKEILAKLANNKKIWSNIRDMFPHPYQIEDAERFIDTIKKQDTQVTFAIEFEHQFAGLIGITLQQDVYRKSAEIGYWLGEKFWNRGVVTEALVAVRDHAMQTHSLTRVFAVPFERSKASCRVLEKAGFLLEGKLRRSALKDGKVVDQLMYAYVIPEKEQKIHVA